MGDEEATTLQETTPVDEVVATSPSEDVESSAEFSNVEADTAIDETVVDDSREFVVVHDVSVHFDIPSPNPVVTFQEAVHPYRALQMPIGLPEAQAMGNAIVGAATARPMTHELFSSALKQTGVDIVALRITGLENGVYRGELDLMGPKGRTVVDCRPTDGVILALRQGVRAPILIASDLFEE